MGPQGPQAYGGVAHLTVLGWLIEHSPSPSALEIVDGDGRVVASSLGHRQILALEMDRLAAVRAGLESATSATEQLSLAKVPGKLGLTAVASIPLEAARQPIRSLRRSALAGMGAVAFLLVIASVIFTHWLAARLERLGAVAQALAKGDLSWRAEVEGDDELPWRRPSTR